MFKRIAFSSFQQVLHEYKNYDKKVQWELNCAYHNVDLAYFLSLKNFFSIIHIKDLKFLLSMIAYNFSLSYILNLTT